MRAPTAAATAAARRQVQHTCERLVADRLIVGSAGNVSVRIGAEWAAVSAGGRLYSQLQPSDHPLVHLPTGAIKGGLPPTSELALHRAVYLDDPTVGAVVHTHSVYAAAFAVARTPLPFVCNENMGPASERVLVTEYAAPGTTDIGASCVAAFRQQPGSRAVLLANHGVVAVGTDLERAYTTAAQVEWIAQVTHHASTLDPNLRSVVVIPEDQQELMATNYGFSIARPSLSGRPAQRGGASRTRTRSAAPRSR